MKNDTRKVYLMLIIITVLAWGGTISRYFQSNADYKNAIEKAVAYEEKEIYIDALAYYKKARETKPEDYGLVMKVADMYYNLRDMNGFLQYCDKAIELQPKNEEAYLKKIDYYMSRSSYSSVSKVLEQAEKKIKDNEKLAEVKQRLATTCIEKYVSFEDIGSWRVQENSDYVAIKEDGKWGLAVKDGTQKIRPAYDYIGAFDERTGVAPCLYEGEYYYIDRNGYRKLVGLETYSYLGAFGNDYAPAQRNNRYGYIDTAFNEYNFEYEFAGAFANGVAAVKKDGKWALINSKLKLVTDFKYDEILVDSNGFCSQFSVIVARQGDKYMFINHEGKNLSAQSFDGASMAASDNGYIAVKIADQWGYADAEGNIVIKPKYEEAGSFCLGMAPVKRNGTWGYISIEDKMVVDNRFSDAKVFSINGAAAVERNGSWKMLVLCEYDN